MRKITAFIFIFAGMSIFLFPHIQNYYFKSSEVDLINEFRQLEDVFSEASSDEAVASLQDDGMVMDTVTEAETEIVHRENKSELIDTIGLIHIDKIDLTLPLLNGATESNLNVGAGLMQNTSEIGQAGNTGIAAHRSHTYGRQFNRLDELQSGDVIKIELPKETIEYEVFEKVVVPPNDVSVLKPMGDNKVISLITCTPMVNPTDRLIVHAKRL